NSNTVGRPDIGPFGYGAPGWVAVVGDWNGDGTTTIGVVDPTTMIWHLRNSNSAGTPDITPFQHRGPRWIPVTGDWNRTGHTGIGVYNGGWYLRNEDNAGFPDISPFAYGLVGWTPVAGTWTSSTQALLAAGGPGTTGKGTAPLTEQDLLATVDAALSRL